MIYIYFPLPTYHADSPGDGFVNMNQKVLQQTFCVIKIKKKKKSEVRLDQKFGGYSVIAF